MAREVSGTIAQIVLRYDLKNPLSHEPWADVAKLNAYGVTLPKVDFPANIYLLKVRNWNIRKRCEICSKLTIKAPERRQWRCSIVFIVNCEHISYFSNYFCCWLWTSKCWREWIAYLATRTFVNPLIPLAIIQIPSHQLAMLKK